ncbi:MAG: TetR/AcrR family transcriptional regulator [Thalassobaculaceae bacterium]|nr:TetR/AcrR family transcriptional regulator [Thalassobaculaceae bacterium]
MTGKPSPTKPRSGRPPKEEAAETSGRIIDAAARLFAAQGFAATSMEQVASACNAGKDTIYRRFPSKLALFGAVVDTSRERILARLETEISAVAQAGDPEARLKRVARWFLTVNLDPELLAFRRIALSEGTVFGPNRPAQAEEDPIMSRLIAVVSEAQAAHVVRSGDPEFLAWHLLHSIVFGPSNEAMLGRTTYDTVAAQDRYFERAWDLFLHGVMDRP